MGPNDDHLVTSQVYAHFELQTLKYLTYPTVLKDWYICRCLFASLHNLQILFKPSLSSCFLSLLSYLRFLNLSSWVQDHLHYISLCLPSSGRKFSLISAMYTLSLQPDFFVQRRQHVASTTSQYSLEAIIHAFSPFLAGDVGCQPRNSNSALPIAMQMERRVPSFQTFIRSVPTNPSANAQNRIPPATPISDTMPMSPTNRLRRSSSVYTCASGVWGAEKVITASRPRSLSASSPQLVYSPSGSPLTPATPEVNPIPPILEPRSYQPLLPSPSPSLAPASARNSYDQPLRMQYNKDLGLGEGYWPSLAASPPYSPVAGNAEYSQSSFDLASPFVAHPPLIPRARSLTPPKSRLSRPFSPPVLHKRDASMKKALVALGVTAEEAGLSPGQKNEQDKSPRTFEYSHYLPQARAAAAALLAKIQDKTPATDEWEDDKDNEEAGEEDLLSSDYHQALVNQYRDLAPSTYRQCDSSDEEDKGRDLRLVPAPLFWKNRQRELYPSRVAHSLSSSPQSVNHNFRFNAPTLKSPKKSHNNKQTHTKRLSGSGAPLKMILASQFKRKSSETAQSEVVASPKTPRSLFRNRRRPSIKRVPSQRSPGRQHLRQPTNKKTVYEPPLPLQLPSIAFRTKAPETPRTMGMKSAPATSSGFAHRRAPEPLSGRRGSEKLRGKSSSEELVDEMLSPVEVKHVSLELDQSGDYRDNPFLTHVEPFKSLRHPHETSKADENAQPEISYDHINSSSPYPRALDRHPTGTPQSPGYLTAEPTLHSTKPTSSGNHNSKITHALHKARSSLSNISHTNSTPHSRNPSTPTSTKSRESTITFDTIGVPYVDGEPVDLRKASKHDSLQKSRPTSSSSAGKSRPKFIEKALEVKRERDRKKNRNALKASIKFVGQVDPNTIGGVDSGGGTGGVANKGRRETFGEGWI
ncbi:hypothetical protein EJ08DRAFT_157517 [Tothia fuscella]|uniref:Uncharacterized protein n=1 Tax=Tothia fuscella TaxID=1048955 RepID=A0A9P4P4Q7_9PEZI|nr:hypothetical protein EJ08DRAFT_157517 [Tothia fuscella]